MPKGIPSKGYREQKKPRNSGSGRNAVYNEPTETVAFRVPISHKSRITVMVNNYLKELKVKK